MDSKLVRQIVFPLLAAAIWGTAFVFQSVGAEHVGPFTFNALRSTVAAIFLALVLFVRKWWNARRGGHKREEATAAPCRDRKALLLGGLLCGTMLAIASNLQQLGLGDTAPGKAAFITALYVVLVPVFGLLFGKKIRPIMWIGVILSVIGLYFLCLTGDMQIQTSDLIVFLCAVCFACHIMIIDRVSPRVDGIALSCAQFVVMAAESAIGMLLMEKPTLAGIHACALPILYVGVLSSGVAYTLQILAQKNSNPTVLSLLLCLESVFAVLSEGLMMARWPSTREWIGCVLMLAAVVLAQLPEGMLKGRKK